MSKVNEFSANFESELYKKVNSETRSNFGT